MKPDNDGALGERGGVWMLDDLLELVLELVVEGAIGAARSKGLPAPVRLALAGILLLLFLGMVGLVLWAGIGSGNGKLVLLGIVLAAGFAAWLVSRIRRLEKGRRRK